MIQILQFLVPIVHQIFYQTNYIAMNFVRLSDKKDQISSYNKKLVSIHLMQIQAVNAQKSLLTNTPLSNSYDNFCHRVELFRGNI